MAHADTYLDGLPVYKDAGRELGPGELNRWQKARADGFLARTTWYTSCGRKVIEGATPRAYVSNKLGRLTPLFKIDDTVPVKRRRKTILKHIRLAKRLARIERARRKKE